MINTQEFWGGAKVSSHLLHNVEVRQEAEVGVGVDEAGGLAGLHEADVIQPLGDDGLVPDVHPHAVLAQRQSDHVWGLSSPKM